MKLNIFHQFVTQCGINSDEKILAFFLIRPELIEILRFIRIKPHLVFLGKKKHQAPEPQTSET